MGQFGAEYLIVIALVLVAVAGLLALPVAIVLTRILIRRFRKQVETSMHVAAGAPNSVPDVHAAARC